MEARAKVDEMVLDFPRLRLPSVCETRSKALPQERGGGRGDERRLKCRFRATLEKRLSSLAYLYPCLHRSRAFPRRFRSTSPFLVFYFFLPPPPPPRLSLSFDFGFTQRSDLAFTPFALYPVAVGR